MRIKGFKSLQKRWKLQSVKQVIIVLVVFACTGFTVLFLKNPILGLMHMSGEHTGLFTLWYYVFILPVYNLLLLIYGFLFGQFRFFWAFEKRMWRRMTGQKPKKESE